MLGRGRRHHKFSQVLDLGVPLSTALPIAHLPLPCWSRGMTPCPLISGAGNYKSKSNTKLSQESHVAVSLSSSLPPVLISELYSLVAKIAGSCADTRPLLTSLPLSLTSTFTAIVLAHTCTISPTKPPFSKPLPTRAFCGRQMGCL